MGSYYGISLLSFANSYIVHTAFYAGMGMATYDPNKKDLLGGGTASLSLSLSLVEVSHTHY
jgi:hypothetical protein